VLRGNERPGLDFPGFWGSVNRRQGCGLGFLEMLGTVGGGGMAQASIFLPASFDCKTYFFVNPPCDDLDAVCATKDQQ